MTNTELREIREAYGLTQKALAELLGYHPNYIARLERGVEQGKSLPITPRLEKLLRSLLRKTPKKKAAQSY
jgi:transcriptional regulator with XRE-family HTH domain